ncbi:Hypothetical protein CINCED_3A003017 [Cinara cedri]|uniref:Pleiotrophin/Midkine C-terminal domain-containing protein n=1 Tax=Cinara cedri TaxID=506608 RepID=A0A5E4N498_9HEMI|nr:Hypothetical protein CINCED_3A003017 [Cinara cedri]
MKWFGVVMVSMLLLTIALVSADKKNEDEKNLIGPSLNRVARAANGVKDNNCHYEKTQWSPCDEKTNVKTRTLTLKKGDETCEKTKKIEKKCKKGNKQNRNRQ